MGAFTHQFESLILKIKKGEMAASNPVISLLLRCNDHLTSMVSQLKVDINAQIDSSGLQAEIEQVMLNPPKVSDALPAPAEDTEISSTPEPDVQSTGGVHVETEPEPTPEPDDETPDAPSPVLAKVTPLQPPSGSSPKRPAGADETLRVSLTKLESLLNFVGEMVILQSVMKEQALATESLLLKRTVHQLGKVGKEIQDLSMGLRMVPVKQTFQKMQRIVRDTAQALDKEIELVLVGEETELDKTVLERINDPLVHLIRNSVDHGIESRDRRSAAGKPTKGVVTLSAEHRSGRLVIEVADDGGGLDPQKLKAKAVEKGLIKPETSLSDKEAWNLIFAPGFSTKEKVTDVSGRGVGMDVVRTNVQELQGDISIDSKLGQGSRFVISLPLTLAIIDSMILTFGGEKFVIPLNHVHETLRPTEKQIHATTGLGDILHLRGENIPLYRLGDFFNRKSAVLSTDMIAIVVRTARTPYAVMVDDILGQRQVVVKKLGPELGTLTGISGSTILGDGKPALILDPVELGKRKVSKPSGSLSSPKASSSDSIGERRSA